MFTRLLVGFDASDPSKRAFQLALDLAKQAGCELHVCSVIEDIPHYAESMGDVDEVVAHGRKHFAAAHRPLAKQAEKAGVKLSTHILTGHPVESLVHLATEQHVDCIVLGGLGHSRILRR